MTGPDNTALPARESGQTPRLPRRLSVRGGVAAPIAASVAFVLEMTLVPLLLVDIRADLGLSLAELAWSFNAYGVAVAVAVLLGGRLGDRGNIARLFCCGVGCFLVGSVAVPLTDGFLPLLGARAVQGFGAGLFSPLVPVMLTRAVPGRPGFILTRWGAIAGYFAAFAPFLGGVLLDLYGWRPVFLVLVGAALVSLAWALSSLKESGTGTARGSPAPGLSRCLRAMTPQIVCILAYVFLTYGCITYFAFNSALVLDDQARGALWTMLYFSIFWFSFAAVGSNAEPWVDTPYVRFLLVAAPVLIALGFVLSGSASAISLLGAAIVGAGFALGNAPSTHMVLKHAPRELHALAASVDITVARLGGVIAVIGLTQLPSAYLFLIALMLIASVLGWIGSRVSSAGTGLVAEVRGS